MLHLFHTSREAAIYLVFRYTVVNQREHLHSMHMLFSVLKLMKIVLQNAEERASLGRQHSVKSVRQQVSWRAHNVLDDVIEPRAEAPACDHSCCHLHAHLLAIAIATSLHRHLRVFGLFAMHAQTSCVPTASCSRAADRVHGNLNGPHGVNAL